MIQKPRFWEALVCLGLVLFLSGETAAQNASVVTPTEKKTTSKKTVKSTLKLDTTSFPKGRMIPLKYTCKGQNISPELSWKGAPPKTKSFALIVDDPDASLKTWVHWVLFNIPVKPREIGGNTYELLENFPRDEKTTEGIVQGLNDFNKIGYDGPCPPDGVHRYYFKLYALDSLVPLAAGASKEQLLRAMKGHELATTQILGVFSK